MAALALGRRFQHGVDPFQKEMEVAQHLLGWSFQIAELVVGCRILDGEGAGVVLVLRPESIRLESKKPDSLTGIIREAVYLGSQMVYEVDMADNIVTVEIANPQEHIIFDTGEEVTLTFQEKTICRNFVIFILVILSRTWSG